MGNPGDEQYCPNHHQTMGRPFQQLEYLPHKTFDNIIYSDAGGSNWVTNSTSNYHGTVQINSGIGYYIIDSTVDGELPYSGDVSY